MEKLKIKLRWMGCFLSIFVLSVIPFEECYAQKSATIKKIWLEHNVTQNGKKGMVVHADFTVYGMKGQKVDCTAYFYDRNKEYLKTTCSGYKTTSGEACTWSYGSATYENSHWSDFTNFMPYEALTLAEGKHNYYCKVYIFDSENNVLTSSDYCSFT